MPKKIYDIKPPKVVKMVKAPVKKRRVVKKFEPAATQPVPKTKRFPLAELAIGFAVIVLLLGIYVYNSFAYATIEISPKTDVLNFQESITADKSYDNVNLLKKIIPARVLQEDKQVSQQFPATGSASNDGKATGTIIVYNKINPSTPLSLKAGTHFLSDGGKYFVSLAKVVIPASKGGVAGSVNVAVQAEESGTQYNIGTSKFSVPGLSGTSYYYGIWGESKTAMTGGYTGNVKKVTKDDIVSAKDVVTKKLLDDAETSLRAKISKDEVLLDGALVKNVTDANADVKEGAVADTFNETVKVTVTALVFKKDDLQKFAKLDAASKLPDNKNLLEKSLDIKYAADSVDAKVGTAKITLNVSAASYYFIDTVAVTDSLSQKSASQIQDAITSQYQGGVLEVKVNFWPFWVHTSPKDKNKIKVELKFE